MIAAHLMRKPRLTILAIALILVSGLSALSSLPRQEDPELTGRYAIAKLALPGASARRVEALITEPVERALFDIEEIKEVNARSQAGLAAINIELDENVTDVEPVWSRIRDAINDTVPLLPSGTRLEFERFSTAAYSMLIAFTWPEGEPQVDILTRQARDLEQRLAGMPGTRDTEIFGDVIEEIDVAVDPADAAALGLTASNVAAAIARSDAKVPAGRVFSGQANMPVEVGGTLDSVARVAAVPVREQDGQTLRVGDIATVAKAFRTPPESIVLTNGRRAVVVAAQADTVVQLEQWSERARGVLKRFGETLPEDARPTIIFDQSAYTAERMESLTGNLYAGVALVVLVIVVFMGWRSAIIISSALPLSMSIVLGLLSVLKVPLNQISVTGLIISLGLAIETAIVMVDEYARLRDQDRDRLEALSGAVSHMMVPLAAGTVITVLTFLPLVLMPGNAGEFVRSLGIAVVLSVTVTMLISVTLVPALSGLLDRGAWTRERRPSGWTGYSNPRWAAQWSRLVERSLAAPWKTISICVAGAFIGIATPAFLPSQFFPPVDRNQFHVQIRLAASANLDDALSAAKRAEEVLRRRPEIKGTHWFVGDQPPRVYYNTTLKTEGAANVAWAFVETGSPEETQNILRALQADLMAALPEALVLALPFEQGPPVEAPLEVRIIGPDVVVLRELGEQMRLLMTQTTGVTFADARIGAGAPTVVVTPDLNDTQIAALDPVTLARELGAALDGAIGGSVLEGTQELPVRVRVVADRRGSLTDIAALPLPAVDGTRPALRPVGALAHVDLEPASAIISRRNGLRLNIIHGYMEPYALPSNALAELRERIAASDFVLPAGYDMEFGGEAEGSSDAQANLAGVFVPLVVLMFATIALAFNSFSAAGLIGVVAIMSVAFAFLSISLFGYPLGFMSIIGVMGLIGIAVSDAIVVLTALRENAVAMTGDVGEIHAITMRETRHVLATTFTDCGGYLPLIIWGGNFWPPMAMAVCGGLVFATFLALTFVPAVFLVQARRRAARAAALRSVTA